MFATISSFASLIMDAAKLPLEQRKQRLADIKKSLEEHSTDLQVLRQWIDLLDQPTGQDVAMRKAARQLRVTAAQQAPANGVSPPPAPDPMVIAEG